MMLVVYVIVIDLYCFVCSIQFSSLCVFKLCCNAVTDRYVCAFFFFFFKQKTAYEMRISDWSSDVALPICIQAHILAETTVGIAQGISTAARNRPRPGRWASRVSAMTRPSSVSRETETTAKTTVLPTARPHSRSSARSRSLSSPTDRQAAGCGREGRGKGRKRRGWEKM